MARHRTYDRRPKARPQPTWLVMARDVSASVKVVGEERTAVAMVLDPATGLILAGKVATTLAEAAEDACTTALTKPMVPAGLVARRPRRVQCAAELLPLVTRLFQSSGPIEVTEAPSYPEAEDIFDSLVGFLSGRAQPSEMPSPDEWAVFYAAAKSYWQAAPWLRWPGTARLVEHLELEDAQETCTAIVLGNEDVRYGLAVVPGTAEADDEGAWARGGPPGTALVLFDPAAKVPEELRAKALRYGWPPDARLMPVTMVIDQDRGHEPSASEARKLTVALAATTEHTSRPLSLVGDNAPTTGTVRLSDGQVARYTVRTAP